MTRKELIKRIEDLLDTDEGILKEDTVLDDIDEWDSLAKLSLLAFAKKELSISLTPNQIRDLETVADICDLLI